PYLPASLDHASFDVLYSRRDVALRVSPVQAGNSLEPVRSRRLNSYVNSPLQGKIAARLVPQLRRFLADRLPDYMVPSEVIVVEQLPRNPNGKVDRKKLRCLFGGTADSRRNYLAPAGPNEELIAGIFEQLLGLDRVGAKDNFFDIGGHSLRATQVVSAVRDVLSVDIPLVDFFNEPTVAGLALRVTAAQRAGSGVSLPAIEPAMRDQFAPLSFAQQRLWFIDQLAPGTSAYNMPLAVRIKGRLNPHTLMQAMSEVVRRHESLRTTFTGEDI